MFIMTFNGKKWQITILNLSISTNKYFTMSTSQERIRVCLKMSTFQEFVVCMYSSACPHALPLAQPGTTWHSLACAPRC
jgi:hypothetical protein